MRDQRLGDLRYREVMKLFVVALLVVGCGEGAVVDCPGDTRPSQCEAICVSADKEFLPSVQCTGNNDVGVEDEGSTVFEFECTIGVIRVDGAVGCCFAGDGDIARFFECQPE